jgi:DNA modification methylase
VTIRILIGDVRDKLRELPDESVHCVVTSPPYFGLRDYGTVQWSGGDIVCSHEAPDDWIASQFNAHSTIKAGQYKAGQSASARTRWFLPDGSCRCGAQRIDRQIGLEPSPAEYVETLVAVFRDVRRVLRKDGTLWLNLGDSYVSNGRYQSDRSTLNGLKPKDLLGIPWRVAFALQADGWWLRQDIIWSKPNPMPESVTDRCTKAHEYLFLLSRSERYYFDAAAIAEPNSNPLLSECVVHSSERLNNGEWPSGIGGRMDSVKSGRNRRSVWTVTTASYPEAHFATFPPALVEPCILAGSPRGGTVLDPFGGAGTTGLVADRLGRSAILIELNRGYARIAERRITDDAPLFAEVDAA